MIQKDNIPNQIIDRVPVFTEQGESADSIPHFDYPPLQANEFDDMWDYTRKSKELYGETYLGRRQISRDSQVDNGVYYGDYGGEAIVVDSKKYPEQYDKVFERAKTKSSLNGEVVRAEVLSAVFSTVSESMRYSQEGVDKLLQEIAESNGKSQFKDGTKVNLGDFIEDGVGVCRHQALVVAVTLEKMKYEGYIRGDVSIERNLNWSPKGEPSGHAWVRYTSHSGTVIILDVAQGFIGRLEDSEDGKHGWDYLRPEEKRERIAPRIGAFIEQNQVV